MPFKNNYIRKKKSLRGLFGIFVTSFVVCLLAFGGISAKAGDEGLVDPIYASDGSLYPVVDYANLLTDYEEQALAERIYEVQGTYNSAIVILTIESTGNRSAMEYADDFYDYKGYGIGEDHDGIIMLISMENRDVWYSTTGHAIKVFTDSDIDYILGECTGSLSAGDYYDAFNTFINECESELKTDYEKGIFTTGKFLVCLAIGVVIGGIIVFCFIMQLLNVAPEKGASNYSSGGFKLTNKSDRFIRSSISKTKIQKDSGSSTHTGSSGTSHGGGGGHF